MADERFAAQRTQIAHVGRIRAALMLTDIVGYSRRMNADEARALTELQRHNELLQEQINFFAGRTVKTIGDAFLVEFAEADEALACALAIHRTLAMAFSGAEPLRLRIGLHVAEVEAIGTDLLGDGVGILSRIEPLSAPGGLCASREFVEALAKPEVHLTAMGPVQVKNIAQPVELFAWPAPEVAPEEDAPATRILRPQRAASTPGPSSPGAAYAPDDSSTQIEPSVLDLPTDELTLARREPRSDSLDLAIDDVTVAAPGPVRSRSVGQSPVAEPASPRSASSRAPVPGDGRAAEPTFDQREDQTAVKGRVAEVTARPANVVTVRREALQDPPEVEPWSEGEDDEPATGTLSFADAPLPGAAPKPALLIGLGAAGVVLLALATWALTRPAKPAPAVSPQVVTVASPAPAPVAAPPSVPAPVPVPSTPTPTPPPEPVPEPVIEKPAPRPTIEAQLARARMKLRTGKGTARARRLRVAELGTLSLRYRKARTSKQKKAALAGLQRFFRKHKLGPLKP